MKFILLAAVLFIFISDTFSQSKKSPVRLSLTAEQASFRFGENTKVKLIFENRTGKAISSVGHLGASFILERTSTRERNCGWNDCYIAFFSPTSKIALPDRGLFEAEVDLAGLHWVDLIDSNRNLASRKKNFFIEITPGNFNLTAELHHSLDLWAENDSRFRKTIESNKILITIETEKKRPGAG